MADKDTTAAPPSSEAYPSSWSPRATRVLQVAVVVMGILIVVGFIVVVFTIVSRMGGDGAEAPVARVGDPEVARILGPEAEVISTETDSGRLAVTVKSAEGVRVVLIDMRSGEIISVIGAE